MAYFNKTEKIDDDLFPAKNEASCSTRGESSSSNKNGASVSDTNSADVQADEKNQNFQSENDNLDWDDDDDDLIVQQVVALESTEERNSEEVKLFDNDIEIRRKKNGAEESRNSRTTFVNGSGTSLWNKSKQTEISHSENSSNRAIKLVPTKASTTNFYTSTQKTATKSSEPSDSTSDIDSGVKKSESDPDSGVKESESRIKSPFSWLDDIDEEFGEVIMAGGPDMKKRKIDKDL